MPLKLGKIGGKFRRVKDFCGRGVDLSRPHPAGPYGYVNIRMYECMDI